MFFMSILVVGILFTNTKNSPSETTVFNSKSTIFTNNDNNIPSSDTHVYNWTHQGINYLTNFSISKEDYQFYKDQKRTWCCNDWKKYITPYDPTIVQIANKIKNDFPNDTEKAIINFAESAKFQYDKDYNGEDNYPKYPIETVIDGRGDCEDLAFLTAALLKNLDIKTVLLYYKQHVAIGIECKNNCTGTYYTYNNTKYYFLETTAGADVWTIGQANQKYIDETPKIEEI